MVTKSLDEMTDAELEEYLAERKRKKTIDNSPKHDIMTSERGESYGNSKQRSEDTGRESPGLPAQQQSETLQGNEQEGTRPVRQTESETGEGIRRESNTERSSGTGSLESSNPSGNSGERERLENNPADKAVARNQSGWDASGRDQPKDLVLHETDDIGHDASAVTRWNANVEAIKTLKKVETEGRQATPTEQKIMTKFSGWGASDFGQAFPLNEDYRYDKDSPWGRRRDELKAITTPQEFKSIESSRKNAFFTTPEVVQTMWKALERAGVDKLNDIRVLEPSAGSGRFLGYQPPEMAAKSSRVAVELDDLTGRMLKQMYPQAEIYSGIGYEQAPIQKDTIDVAISNVPFGDYQIFDPTFKKDRKKLTHSIHNYFFAKTLENLRPGGLLAFVTTHQTLDAPTAKPIREALAKEANLVDAIRLPNNAFPDTQVVTDIIIMQKRMPGEKPGNQDWVDTVKVPFTTEDYVQDPETKEWGQKTTLSVNKYFVNHPDKVLGVPSAEGSMHRGGGKAEYTVEGPVTPLNTLLEKVPQHIPANIITTAPRREPTKARFVGYRNNEGAHVIQDNAIFVQKGSMLEPTNYSTEDETKVKGLLAIRDAEREAINIMSRNGSGVELDAAQKKLNTLYQDFVLKYGAISAPKNYKLLENDPDMPLLKALENNNVFRIPKDKLTEDEKRLIKVLKGNTPVETTDLPKIQTDIFNKRTIHGYTEKPITDYADAESVVKNETGTLDIPLMAKKLGKTEAETIKGLIERNLIYLNPQTHEWQAAEEYLTGDVRGKLKVAQNAANGRPRDFGRNVEALTAVQPEEIPAAQIAVRMGAPWIPPSDINQFVRELLEGREHQFGRHNWGEEADAKRQAMLNYYRYNDKTGEWAIDYKPETSNAILKNEYGTEKLPAHKIIEKILNGQLIEINKPKLDKDGNPETYTTKSGKIEVVMERDDDQTILAQEKAKVIQDKFQEWIWSDTDRTARLQKEYNDKFNNYRPRIFDGQHLILPGMAEKWSKRLHSHSKDAIWRILQDRTALLAHEVGFGKTNIMIASGMELKRLGLAQKPLFVVPKTTHEQFKEQFLDLYPYAKVLSPDKDEFGTDNRAEFVSRAATGDWDAVVLSYEQLEKIPVKPETEKRFLDAEMADLEDAIREEAANNPDPKKKTPTQKELEAALARYETRLKYLNNAIRERSDKTMYFDDLGIDQMYVDEADNFKNLHFTTRMGRIKGLPNGKAQRAWDMYTKTKLLKEDKNNGIVFATGTPIANTIAEMYTMMRYLQEPMLEEKGLKNFDSWAKTFGETTESIEQNATGQYKMTQRFSKFQNVPELSHMWQQVADIRVADEVPAMVAQRPKIINEQGKEGRTVVPVSPTKELLDYMLKLADRAEHLRGKPEKGGDNMLKISGDARKASLDMRLVDPTAKDNPDGKVTAACKKITEIYNEPFTKANKGTQLVFLDMGTPKAKPDDEKPVVDPDEMQDENEETAEELSLLKDVYSSIKKKLIENGIPEKDIAFIHDAKTDKQRTALFDRVRAGDIRVLIGSTGKMGAGVNVQDRAAALHHLDAPWRPRDIEQREGRIVRAGNKVYGPKLDEDGKVLEEGKGVRVYTYVTEKSFDAFMWQAIEVKSKAIKSIMRRSAPPRAIEDVDSFTMSAGEAKAIATGNPDVMKAVTLKNAVTRLQLIKNQSLDSKLRAEAQLKQIPEKIKRLQDTIATLETTDKLIRSKGEGLHLKVEGKDITDNKEGVADEALKEAVKHSAQDWLKPTKIGEYKGLDVSIDWQASRFGPVISLQNPETKATFNTSPLPVDLIQNTGKPNTVLFPDNVKVLSRMSNIVSDFDRLISLNKAAIESHEKDIKLYQEQANKKFEREDQLNRLQAELTRLEKKLQGQEVEEGTSESFEDVPEDTTPTYHYGERTEELNPKAEIEAVKAVVEPVEKDTEVKPPPAKIEKIVEKMAEPVKEEPLTPQQIATEKQITENKKMTKEQLYKEMIEFGGTHEVLMGQESVAQKLVDEGLAHWSRTEIGTPSILSTEKVHNGKVVPSEVKPKEEPEPIAQPVVEKKLSEMGGTELKENNPRLKKGTFHIHYLKKDIPVDGEKVIIPEFENYNFFIARPIGYGDKPTNKDWDIYEATTGMSIGTKNKTKADAIEEATTKLKRLGEQALKNGIERGLEQQGIKPKVVEAPKSSIDNVPPDLPEIKDVADTTKEKNVVYGSLNDPRSNEAIARDMHTNAETVTEKQEWKPEENDLPGWDTTDIKEYHDGYEKVYPGLKAKLEQVTDGDLSGRVKTLESVVKKLKKKNVAKPPYTQNNMEDIIGMRLTFNNQKDILEAAKKIKDNFTVTQEEDYITHPKDGYRSYHLNIKHDGKPAEIQLRTPNQTIWADWMHDTFYDHPNETKARLGEEDFKKAKAYSLAMADYFAKLDRGELAEMPEGLPNHPEFKPKGLEPEPPKYTIETLPARTDITGETYPIQEYKYEKPKEVKPRKPRIKEVREVKASPEVKPVLALPEKAVFGVRELQERNEQRSNQAQALDKAKSNKVTITSDNPMARRWNKDPGSMDVLGVDNPPSITKPTVETQDLAALGKTRQIPNRHVFANAKSQKHSNTPKHKMKNPGLPKANTKPHIVPPHYTRRGHGVTRRGDR